MDGGAERGKKISRWGSRKHKKTEHVLAPSASDTARYGAYGAPEKDGWRTGQRSGCFVEPSTEGDDAPETDPVKPPVKRTLAEPAPMSAAAPVTSMEEAASVPSEASLPYADISSSPMREPTSFSGEFSRLPPVVHSLEAELHDAPSRRHRGRRLFGKLTRSLSKNRSLPPSPDRMSASSQDSLPQNTSSRSKEQRSSSQPPSPERRTSHSHRRWWFSRTSSQAKSQPTTPERQGSKFLDQDRGPYHSAEPTSPVPWLPASTGSWGGSTVAYTAEGGDPGAFPRSPQGADIAGWGTRSAPTTPQGKGFSQWSAPSTPQSIASPPSSGPNTPSARGPQWMSLGSPPLVQPSDWSPSSAASGLENPPLSGRRYPPQTQGLQATASGSPIPRIVPGLIVPRYAGATESPGGSDWNGSTGEAWQSASNSLSSSPHGWGMEQAAFERAPLEGVPLEEESLEGEVLEGVPVERVTRASIVTAPSLDAGFGSGTLSFDTPAFGDTPSKETVCGVEGFEEPGDPSPVSVLSRPANREQQPLTFPEEPLATVEEVPSAEAVEEFDFGPPTEQPSYTPPRAKGDGREKDPRALFLKEDALVLEPGSESGEQEAGGEEGPALEESGLKSERPNGNVDGPLKLEGFDSESLKSEDNGAAEEAESLGDQQAAGALTNEGKVSESLPASEKREAMPLVGTVPAAEEAESEGPDGADAASKVPRVSAGISDLVSYFESEAFKKTENPYAGGKATLSRTESADVRPGEAVTEAASSLVLAEPIRTAEEEELKREGSIDKARFGALESGPLPEKTDSLSGILRAAPEKGLSALEKLLASSQGASGVVADASNAGRAEADVSSGEGFEGSAQSAPVESEKGPGVVLEQTEEPGEMLESPDVAGAESEAIEERSALPESTEERIEKLEPTEPWSAVAEAPGQREALPVSTQEGTAEWEELVAAVLEATEERIAAPISTEERDAAPIPMEERIAAPSPTKERIAAPIPTGMRGAASGLADTWGAVSEATEERSVPLESTEEQSAVRKSNAERDAPVEATKEKGAVPQRAKEPEAVSGAMETPSPVPEPTEEGEAVSAERSAVPEGTEEAIAVPEAAKELGLLPEAKQGSAQETSGSAAGPAVRTVSDEPNGTPAQELPATAVSLTSWGEEPEERSTVQGGTSSSAAALSGLQIEKSKVGEPDVPESLPVVFGNSLLGVEQSAANDVAAESSVVPVEGVPAKPSVAPFESRNEVQPENQGEEGSEEQSAVLGGGSGGIGGGTESGQKSRAVEGGPFDESGEMQDEKQFGRREAEEQGAAQTSENLTVCGTQKEGDTKVDGAERGTEEGEGDNDGVDAYVERDANEERKGAVEEYEQYRDKGIADELAGKNVAGTPAEDSSTQDSSTQENTGTHRIDSAPENKTSENSASPDSSQDVAEPSLVANARDGREPMGKGHVSFVEESIPKEGVRTPLQDSQQGRIDEPEEDVESDAATRQLSRPTDVTDDASSGAVRLPEDVEADVSREDREEKEQGSEDEPLLLRQHDVIQARPMPPPPHPVVQILLVSGILAKAAVKTGVGLTYVTAKQCGVLAKVATNGVIDDVKGVAGSLLGYAGRMVGLGKSSE